MCLFGNCMPGLRRMSPHILAAQLCHCSWQREEEQGRGAGMGEREWEYTLWVLNTYLWQLNSLWSCAWDSSGSRRDTDTRPYRPPLLTWWSACRHVPPRGTTSAPDTFHPTSACPVQSLSRVYRRWKETRRNEKKIWHEKSPSKGVCVCLVRVTFKAAHLVVNFYQNCVIGFCNELIIPLPPSQLPSVTHCCNLLF